MASPPSFSGRICAADYIIPHTLHGTISFGSCDFSSSALTTLGNVLVTGAGGISLTNGAVPSCSITTDVAGQMILRSAAGSRVNANDVLSFGDLTVTQIANATRYLTVSVDGFGLSTFTPTGVRCIFAKAVEIASVTGSSSTSTGALIVGGGVGVAQNVYVGGALHLPTSGGTSTGLIYYEDTSAAPFSYLMTGAVTTISLTGYYVRINGMVTLIFNPLTPAANVANALLSTAAASIPARFRPASDTFSASIIVVDNSIAVLGTVTVTVAGAIVFAVNAVTAFANAGNTGVYGGSITYHV
jgi:hypothetical protein